MMIRPLLAACALGLALATPGVAQEDPLPPTPYSARVMLSTESVWRGLVLSEGLSLRSGVTFPLLTTPAPGGMSDGLQVELDGWTRLAGDPGPTLNDQYAGTLRYLRHLGGGAHPATYVGAHYRAYFHPHGTGLADDVTHEAGVSGAYEIRNAARGLQGFVFHGQATHSLGAVDGTYTQGGLVVAFPTPTIQWVDAEVGTSVSLSDYDTRGVNRDFGYAGAELQAVLRFPLFLRDVLAGRASWVPRAGVILAHGPRELERNAVSGFVGLEAGF